MVASHGATSSAVAPGVASTRDVAGRTGPTRRGAGAVTPAGEKVSVDVGCDGDALVFTVRDHGPGVPPSERSRIFEPFHTTRAQGTGLGLALARRIVKLHGGQIDVDDAPGGGALFRVRIP